MYSSMEKMNITPGTTNSFLRDYQRIHPFFKVDSFSWLVKAEIETYTSAVFESGGYKWKLILYPNGNGTKKATAEDYIALYLSIQETESWPPHWGIKVDVKLLVYNHIKKKYVTIKDCGEPMKQFNELERQWGFLELFDLKTFMDETNGFLLNNCCVFAAEIYEQLDDATGTKCFPIKGYNIQNGTLRMVREFRPAHFLFPVKSFSAIDKQNGESHESEIFEAGGFKWRLSVYPNGNEKANVKDHISLYLRIEETNALDANWEVYATLKFFVYDHIHKNYLTVEELDGTPRRFAQLSEEWGVDRLIGLNDFKYISNGFLLDDSSCTFGVEVFVVKQQGKKPKLSPVWINNQVFVVQGSPPAHTWMINNFSAIHERRFDSEKFSMGGTNWYLQVYPRMSRNDLVMAIYLYMDSALASSKWFVDSKVGILDQINHTDDKMWHSSPNWYTVARPSTSIQFYNFGPLESLHDHYSGFFKNNTVIVQLIFDSVRRG